MLTNAQLLRPLVSVALDRADHLEEVLGDWSPRVLQLEPGEFGTTVDIRRLEHLTVRRCTTTKPLVLRLEIPTDSVVFIKPLPGSSPLLWRRHSLQDQECLVLPGGTDAEIVTRAMHSHVSITCRLRDLRRLAPPSSAWRSGLREMCVDLRTPSQGGLRDVFRYAEAMLQPESSPELHPSDVEGLNRLSDLGWMDVGDPVQEGPIASSARRFSAVLKARAFIHENLTATLRLADICRHAHAQARTLEYGFREMLGITPIAYLKVLRLHRARNRLREAGPDSSITRIALECGFCHLSQFASDYRHQFGERPSETRRRALDRPRSWT